MHSKHSIPNLPSVPSVKFCMISRFYAKLAELRQRIRANSMPTLNKDPDTLEARHQRYSDPPPQPTTLPLSSSASLPRPAKPRMQTVLESQQLTLELSEQEKPPLPPKPSPPTQYQKYIISPQPFRKPEESKLTLYAGSTPFTNKTTHVSEGYVHLQY